MKVMLVNGSSHKNGTTMVALNEMISVFKAEGIECEIIHLGSKPIADCLSCGHCAREGSCVIKDDGVNGFLDKAANADGFVFGTPVYFAHPSGRILSFLDRAFYTNGRGGREDVFRFKPGASVAVARRGGTTASFDALNKYFGISQMPVAGSTYWNMVHGAVADDAYQDEEGLQTMRNLAHNMVWMMRSFKAAKEAGIPLPPTERGARTNFIR